VAKPLRFRRSTGNWTLTRVRNDILQPLDSNLGAEMTRPWYAGPDGYDCRRFEMDNGDFALFCWNGSGYWLGNTETPSTLWRTDKFSFAEVPDAVSEWAERELLAQLHEESPWLAAYPHISEFFLPVLLSKDGRHTSREFLREYAAGFPDTDPEDGLAYYEELLASDALDDRHVMAGKLGTSEHLNLGRMRSAMSEFTVAKLLHEQGVRRDSRNRSLDGPLHRLPGRRERHRDTRRGDPAATARDAGGVLRRHVHPRDGRDEDERPVGRPRRGCRVVR